MAIHASAVAAILAAPTPAAAQEAVVARERREAEPAAGEAAAAREARAAQEDVARKEAEVKGAGADPSPREGRNRGRDEGSSEQRAGGGHLDRATEGRREEGQDRGRAQGPGGGDGPAAAAAGGEGRLCPRRGREVYRGGRCRGHGGGKEDTLRGFRVKIDLDAEDPPSSEGSSPCQPSSPQGQAEDPGKTTEVYPEAPP